MIDKINNKIKRNGLKKSFIAESIGISNVTLSYYLNNKRPVPEKVLNKLVEFLQIK